METVKVEVEIPRPPEGWRFDGYRSVQTGEHHLIGAYWFAWDHPEPTGGKYLVAVKIG